MSASMPLQVPVLDDVQRVRHFATVIHRYIPENSCVNSALYGPMCNILSLYYFVVGPIACNSYV